MTTAVVNCWLASTETACAAMLAAALAVGRVGQVEPQCDLDAELGPAGSGDHEAVAGDEAEQVRDDGQQVSG